MSPISWLIFMAGFLPLLAILFEPSLGEFLIMLAVDMAASFLLLLFDQRVGKKYFPTASIGFLDFDPERVKKLPQEDRASLFSDIMKFPSRRARFCFFATAVKALPGSLVIIFYWKYEWSLLTQCLKLLLVELTIWSYYFGAVFIESHLFLSKRIAEFHEKHDWSEVFSAVSAPPLTKDYARPEYVSLAAICFIVFSLQFMSVMTTPPGDRLRLAMQIPVIGFCGLILFGRIWYLQRKYFLGGLESLFTNLADFQPESFRKVLPLHSEPLLARFDGIFNSLVERIRSYDFELSRWVFLNTEKSRYHALGELSGMIVHDLSGPLHVVNFCCQELKENPNKILNPVYVDQLSQSGNRSLELIQTLKAYLKGGASGEKVTSFSEVHAHALRLLSVQFYSRDFSQIEFKLSPALEDLRFRLVSADLLHILMNLFGNSAENLLTNKIQNPIIEVGIHAGGATTNITLFIRDNGTGLTKERFEELTAFNHFSPSLQVSGRGLGLRLIRRLIERNNGALEVLENSRFVEGTTFLVTLPVAGEAGPVGSYYVERENHLDN